VLEPECAGTPQGRQLECLRREERVAAPLPRPRRVDRRPQLLEHVDRRRGRGAVRADADPHAGRDQSAERRDPAAEDGVRARAVRNRDVVLCEQADLLVVCLDTVRGRDAFVQHADLGELPDRSRAVRRAEQVRVLGPRAAAGGDPQLLGLALGEMRCDREPERIARFVQLG
jgi:hypothetical protein